VVLAGIILSPATHSFGTRDVGYQSSDIPYIEVTVTNTGGAATAPLSIAMEGSGFAVSPDSLPAIAPAGTAVFDVRPTHGLGAGTHEAAITVSGGGQSATLNVSFAVRDPDLPDLPAPTGLAIDGTVLRWNAVEHAAGYRVYAGEVPVSAQVSVTEFDLADASPALTQGSHRISVMAIANPETHNNSPRSETVDFEVEPDPDLPYLPAPTGLAIDGTVLRWNAVEHAAGYRVYADEVPVSAQIAATEFDLTDADPALVPGTHQISVIAIANHATHNNSPRSAEVDFVVAEPVFAIEIDVPGGSLTLDSLDEYYEANDAAAVSAEVTVRNAGNRATGALRVAVSGDPAPFEAVFVAGTQNIGVSGSAILTVTPRLGLAQGNHSATVTISGPEGSEIAPQSFTVGLEVLQAQPTVAVQLAQLRLMEPTPATWQVTTFLPVEHIAPQSLVFATTVEITLTRGNPGDALQLGRPGSMFTVGNNATLILQDVELRGIAANTSALVAVTGGVLEMRAGSGITGNTNTTGVATMPELDNQGGGVRIAAGGRLVMNGGEIHGNRAAYGGGVINRPGTFEMHGGTIRDNTATRAGGGLDNDGGTFDMHSGATISGNSAPTGGGVTTWYNGVFNMHDGEILGNVSTGGGDNGGGGGVRVGTNGVFEMYGGEIRDNRATHGGGGGGGVRIGGRGGVFEMHDGTIRDNEAANIGGGVSNWTHGEFNMRGGEIVGNEARFGGGGVSTFGEGWFTMRGGAISGNRSTMSEGGGVNANVGATFIMSGGIIHGRDVAAGLANTATQGAALSNMSAQVVFGVLPPGANAPPTDYIRVHDSFSLTIDVAEGRIIMLTVPDIPAEYQGRAMRLSVDLGDAGMIALPAAGTGVQVPPGLSATFAFPSTPRVWHFEMAFFAGGTATGTPVATYTVTANLARGANTLLFDWWQ